MRPWRIGNGGTSSASSSSSSSSSSRAAGFYGVAALGLGGSCCCAVFASEGTKRNARTVATAIKVGLRYGRALRQLRSQFKVEGDLHLVTEPERYEDFLSPVHEASAQDIAKLCQENGGAYIKAAQFASVRSDIPREYQKALSLLQDQVEAVPFEEVDTIFREDFGCSMTDAFAAVEKEALAAGSLAQVHKARTVAREGKEGETDVVLKIQFPNVSSQCAWDMNLLTFLSQFADKIFFRSQAAGKTTSWFVRCLRKYLEAELDFKRERLNILKASEIFEDHSRIQVPQCVDVFCSSRVLTMQFVPGVSPSSGSLRSLGIDEEDFAQTLSEINVRQFKHKAIHCDLHPGNLLLTSSSAVRGGAGDKGEGETDKESEKKDWNVYLIDHGMYCDLSDNERLYKTLCELWIGLSSRSHAQLMRACTELGIREEHLAVFYPLLFEGDVRMQKKAWECLPKKLRRSMSERVRQAKANKTLLKEILSFAQCLPQELLMIQRCNVLHHFYIEHGLSLTEVQKRKLTEHRLAGYRQVAKEVLTNEQGVEAFGLPIISRVQVDQLHQYVSHGYRWLQQRISQVRNNLHSRYSPL